MKRKKTSSKRRTQLKATTYPTYLDLFEDCFYDLFSPKSKKRLVDYEFVSNLFSVTLFASYITVLNSLATFLIAFLGIFIGTSMISYNVNTLNSYSYAAENMEVVYAPELDTDDQILGAKTEIANCVFNIENQNYSSAETYKIIEQTVTVCASQVPQNSKWFLASNETITPVEVLSSDYDADCAILTEVNYDDTLFVSNSDSLVSQDNSCYIRFE